MLTFGRVQRWVGVVASMVLCLAIAAPTGAQVIPTAPSPEAEPTPVPSPTPDPLPEAEDDNASEPGDDQKEPEARDDAVPDEQDEASSERIQYRDALDIEEEPLKLKWDNFLSGLRGITQYSLFENQVRFRLGFRFQGDSTLVAPSDDLERALGDMPDEVNFRRFRLFAEGILRKMYFRVEFDFAADAGFKTFYLEGREGGLAIWGHLLGKFRYGQFQEPFSLEQNMSTFDTSFVEVSMPISAIAPGSNIGTMVYDASKNRKFTWAAGAFSWGRETSDNASTSVLSLTGRFGFQPVARHDGGTIFHAGISFSSRTPTGDEVRYEARPEARFVRPFADTGNVPSSHNTLVGLEAAWKNGSMWAQAEWIRANVDSSEGGSPHFDGIAIQTGYFLTGLSRPWDNLLGVWGRVRPEQSYHWGNPFKKSSGGVWEVAARYSTVDLTDGHVQGGVVRDITVGVNWYPSTTIKLQFNWIHSRVEDTGYANIWVLRYQYAIK
jgi:phosphate-selective porin OprO and OprP